MTNLIMMIGLPGSGKSTWINSFIKNTSREYVIASTDNLIELEAKQNNTTYDKIWEQIDSYDFNKVFFETLSTCSKNKLNVIVDRTNLTFNSRKRILYMFSEYNKTAVCFHTELDLIYKRIKSREIHGKTIPSNVINGMIESYQKPTHDEFDVIVNTSMFVKG